MNQPADKKQLLFAAISDYFENAPVSGSLASTLKRDCDFLIQAATDCGYNSGINSVRILYADMIPHASACCGERYGNRMRREMISRAISIMETGKGKSDPVLFIGDMI